MRKEIKLERFRRFNRCPNRLRQLFDIEFSEDTGCLDPPIHFRQVKKTASTKRTSRNRRRLWIWLPIAAIALGAGWYFLSARESSSQKSTYLAETVERGNIENSITAVGTLSALRSINVGAQVSGQLKSVKVEVGDEVKQGDLIAEIDPSPFEKK